MKRLCIVALFLFLSLLISTHIHAVDVPVFGPEQFNRTKGAPNEYTDSFAGVAGEASMTVKNGNGNGKNRVSSARIHINGEQVFGPSDFNPKVNTLTKTIELTTQNSISVELKSKPGSYLAIEIIQDVAVPIVSILADPETVQLGETSTITWNSYNADTLSIEPDIGSDELSGSIEISPTETTTYTATVTGLGGTVTAGVTITVLPTTPTVNITASPGTIQPGESTTLSWSSVSAQNAHIDNGIGVVSVNGSISVSPAHTTTYTITVTGPEGSAGAQAVVMVQGNPVSPPEGSFGEQYTDIIPADATIDEYDSRRFSLITGLVHSINGLPLADVSITVLDHLEYGTASSDVNGRFTIPVEGGAVMTVAYKKTGYIPAHRKVYVPWNDIAVAETIQMIEQDPVSTTVTFDGNPETVIAHESTEITDEFGSRSATLVFTGDNIAYLVDENGSDVQQLTTITARATEFTTSESMPAVLPPNSAYTYCVELEVDGVKRVRFEKPVITWVDNFLGFDVGEVVPVGYYDRDRGVWVPSDNGVVVKLLDTDADGIVDAMDATGDDQPDDINGNGFFTDEVTGLDDNVRYPPNATFWRVEVTHFTPWDCNWPYGPPSDAIPPNPDGEPEADQQKEEQKDCRNSNSSFVEERSRIFHEDIPVPGTDITLHYASNRVKGYQTGIVVPASGDTVPASLNKIIVRVEIAGRTLEQILDPLPNQKAEFIWDGLDHTGKRLVTPTTAHISIGFKYDLVYYSARADFARSFAQAGTSATFIGGRQGMISWRRSEISVYPAKAKGGGDIADGWNLSLHHFVNPGNISTLHKGDGNISKLTFSLIEKVAGNHKGYSGDGGPATEAELNLPRRIAVDASGNLYIADTSNSRVRKVDTSGIITTIAGTGNLGDSGDGGPATEAELYTPRSAAVDASGNLYITSSHRVRMVNTSGIITTVAGTGVYGYSGDGGPATEAELWSPAGVAVDTLGNLYIADTSNNRIRMVNTSGIITTVAGTGVYGYSGDGGPATEAELWSPTGVAVDTSGNLYIADSRNFRIRKVDTTGIITTVAGTGIRDYNGDGIPATEANLSFPTGVAVDTIGNLYITSSHRVRMVNTSGIITTVAGTGVYGYSGDGGPATEAELRAPFGTAVDASGNLYIADTSNNRIRLVRLLTAIMAGHTTGDDIPYFESSGLGHIMSPSGFHKTTIDLDTGVVLYEFDYDEDNNLVSITDRFGNVISIQRDANGTPVSITSPDGITTVLSIDAENRLTRVTYPDGSQYDFEYTAYDLMKAKVEPEGNRFVHDFTATGRLANAFDEEGGLWNYVRTEQENGDILTRVTTGEGNLTTYLDHTYSTGRYVSSIIDPTGAETMFIQSADGLTTEKSLACGMDLEFKYGVDSEYTFKFVKEMRESTPAALERVTLRDKTYQDTDSDDVFDLITETVTINGKAITHENNVLQSEKTVTSPEGRTVTMLYDPDTLVTTTQTTPGFFDTTYGYDTSGRLTSIDTNTRGTEFAYTAQGFLETVTDPENHVTSYTYDPVGRITAIDRPDGSSLGFAYDQNGNMSVLTNPATIDHAFGFNKVNLTSSYQTPLSGSYSYVYDKDRRLVQTNFPSGKQIFNIYDTTRLAQIQTPEGNIDYTYHCGTKVGSISKNGESISYDYDGKLVTSETLSGTLNQSLGYTYNNDFNISGFTYAGSTGNYTYDNDGLLTGAGDITIGRNAQNGLPESVSGGSLNLTRTFNGYGEVSDEAYTVGGQAVTSWSLTRDNNGRITNKTESVAGTTSNFVYAYDTMGRLLSVTKGGTLVEEYDYDVNGTRIYEMNPQRGIAGRTFNYDDEDRLLSVDGTTYLYDFDGFLTTRTEGTNVTSYAYSSRGELLTVDLPDGTAIEYLHDPLGRRIAKIVDGNIIEKYLWQGLTRLLAVYDGSDDLRISFEYADGRMPNAMTKDGFTYYLTYDQVGSLRVVADASGNVIKRIEYDAFGNVIEDTNPTFDVPFGFAGGLYDPDTGLVRFGYRDYDPDIGRWTAKDPIGFAGGDTDLYGYVLNNPINFIDPWGLEQSRVSHLDWFSRSLSPTGGPPPGIDPVPVPWSEYGRGIMEWGKSLFDEPCTEGDPADLNGDGKVDGWDEALWFFGRRAYDLPAPPFVVYPPGYGNEGPGSNSQIFDQPLPSQ